MMQSERASTDSMTCDECIGIASEFVDDALPPEIAQRFRFHLAQCASCARYHHVLTRGLTLVRDVPEIEPAPDFVLRLHRQLRAVDDEMLARQRSVTSGVAVALAVAGLVAFAAWSPILLRDETAPAVTSAEPAQPSVPTVDGETLDPWDLWYGGSASFRAGDEMPNLDASFPGPYSPLIVQPPDAGARRRNVLATYGSE
jgi:hypothetical protein